VPLGTTNLEVEFPLCWCAVLESGCTQVQSWLAPSSPALAKRIVVPGGPDQYCAVQQYSVVRRIWGASGVAGFLIFAPPTPPQNLIAEILSTPVRCSHQRGGQTTQTQNRLVLRPPRPATQTTQTAQTRPPRPPRPRPRPRPRPPGPRAGPGKASQTAVGQAGAVS
jgi:hypothetical protein